MHFRTIIAIARKDTLDTLLNKATLFTLLTPILLAILYAIIGAIIGTPRSANILIYDPGHTGIDQLTSSIFSHSNITYANAANAVSKEFGSDGLHKDTGYALGLIVPDDFDSNLRKGKHPQISIYLNGDATNAEDRRLVAQLLTNYANTLANPRPAINLTIATINPPTADIAQDINITYTVIIVLTSLITGATLIPNLIVEEKEKKTLRMLMVSPASFSDIIIGKVLVGACYQLLLTLIVIAIMRGFIGNIPLLLLFILLGTLFVIALGILVSNFFKTINAVNAFVVVEVFLLIVPGMFVGFLGSLLISAPIMQIIKIIPTYFLAEGVNNALQNRATVGSTVLELSIVIGSTLVLFLIALWSLRQQAEIASTI